MPQISAAWTPPEFGQLRERAADLREAAAANVKRLLRDLSARRTQKGRTRA